MAGYKKGHKGLIPILFQNLTQKKKMHGFVLLK